MIFSYSSLVDQILPKNEKNENNLAHRSAISTGKFVYSPLL